MLKIVTNDDKNKQQRSVKAAGFARQQGVPNTKKLKPPGVATLSISDLLNYLIAG